MNTCAHREWVCCPRCRFAKFRASDPRSWQMCLALPRLVAGPGISSSGACCVPPVFAGVCVCICVCVFVERERARARAREREKHKKCSSLNSAENDKKRKSTKRESARGTSTSSGSKEKLAERLRAGGAGLFTVGARALAMVPVVVAGEKPGMRGSGAGAGRVLPLSDCTKDIFIYLQKSPHACMHA